MGNSLKQTRALIFICLWVIFFLRQKKKYSRVLDVYYMEGEFSADNDWTKDGKHWSLIKLKAQERPQTYVIWVIKIAVIY